MKTREALVSKIILPELHSNYLPDHEIRLGIAFAKIIEDIVSHALFDQSTTKNPGFNMIKLSILKMIWSRKKLQIIRRVQHVIRLGYHPKKWRKARGILLQKPSKRDFGLARLYLVISLINFMRKVVEKVVTEQFSRYCEIYIKFHPGEIDSWKERSAINAVAILVHTIEK